jgi:MFS family permease
MSNAADTSTTPESVSEEHLGVVATFRRTPRAVKAVLAGIFVGRLAGFLMIFLVVFLTHRGYSSGQAGFALGMYGAGAVLGNFVGGWLSDRLDARSATAISMFGSSVLIVSILYVSLYPLILVAVVLVSTVGQLYRPAAQTLITELTPPKQLVMVTAMQRLSLNLATTVTPLVGAALLSVSYSLLFWGEAAAAVAYGLIALLALPQRPARIEPQAETEAGAGTLTATGAEAAVRPPRSGYLAVLSDWRYDVFLAAVFFITIVYSQYTAALPLAIVKSGQSLWWYSAVVSLNAVIVATCEVWATRFVQTWPLRVTALIGNVFLAVGYAVYAIGLAPGLLILGTILWTSSEITGAPTTFAYPGLIAPPHLRGRYIGAMMTSFGIGNTIGPIAGVALWSSVGNTVFVWAAGAGIVATLCALVGLRPPVTGAPAPSLEPVPEPAG